MRKDSNRNAECQYGDYECRNFFANRMYVKNIIGNKNKMKAITDDSGSYTKRLCVD